MQTILDSSITFSRPIDETLEAYKAWIMEIASRLTTDTAALHLTEQEWIESWKEYWKHGSKEPSSGVKD